METVLTLQTTPSNSPRCLHCSKKLNLGIKAQPVTAGAEATLMSGFCAHTRIICPEAFAPAVTGLLFTQRFILLFYFWDSVSRPSRPALNLILTAKCVNISSASFQNCLRYVKVSTIFFNDLRFFFGT